MKHLKKIYIEISDICGLSCSFCPNPKNTRGIMSLDLFSRALSEAKKHTKIIALHILGDPLALKNIKEYLNLAQDFKLEVEITTSGAYLNDFKMLLSAPIRQVNISLDAILELKNYESLLQKIFTFCYFRRDFPTKTFINLRIQNKKNNVKIKRAIENEFGIKLEHARTRLWEKTIIDIRPFFAWEGNFYNQDITNLKSKSKVNENLKILDSKKPICYALIEHIGILSNGNIVPCCMDAKGEMVLGNIARDSIKTILQSPRARAMCEGFKNGKIIEARCVACEYRKIDKNIKKIL